MSEPKNEMHTHNHSLLPSGAVEGCGCFFVVALLIAIGAADTLIRIIEAIRG